MIVIYCDRCLTRAGVKRFVRMGEGLHDDATAQVNHAFSLCDECYTKLVRLFTNAGESSWNTSIKSTTKATPTGHMVR